MRLADVEIGERYLWSASAPTRRARAGRPIAEVEAVDIVKAQQFRVRGGNAARTHERRVVVRNVVNGVTRTVAARYLQPIEAAWPFDALGAAVRV
jgi:hypothetical protein